MSKINYLLKLFFKTIFKTNLVDAFLDLFEI